MKKIALLAALLLAVFSFAACAPEIPSGSSDVPSSNVPSSDAIDDLLRYLPDDIKETIRLYISNDGRLKTPNAFVKALTYLLGHNKFDLLAEIQQKNNMRFDYSQMEGKVKISDATYRLVKKEDYRATYEIRYLVTKSSIDGIALGQNFITVTADKSFSGSPDEYVYFFMPGKQNITPVLRRAGWNEKVFGDFVITFQRWFYPKMEEEPELLERYMCDLAVFGEGTDVSVEGYNAFMKKYFGLEKYYTDAGTDEKGIPLIKDIYGNVLPMGETDSLWWMLWKIDAGIVASGTGGDTAFIDVAKCDDDFALHTVSSHRYEFKKRGDDYIAVNPDPEAPEKPALEPLLRDIPSEIAESARAFALNNVAETSPDGLVKALVYLLKENRFDILAEMQNKDIYGFDYAEAAGGKVKISDAFYKTVSEKIIEEENNAVVSATYLLEYTVMESSVPGIDVGRHAVTVITERGEWEDDTVGYSYYSGFMPGEQSMPDVLENAEWGDVFRGVYYLYIHNEYPLKNGEPDVIASFIKHIADKMFPGDLEGKNAVVKKFFGIDNYYSYAKIATSDVPIVKDIYKNTVDFENVDGNFFYPLYYYRAGIVASGETEGGAWLDVAEYDDSFALHITTVERFEFEKRGDDYILVKPE